MMWIAEADTSDQYKLLVCVPRGARLYVLIAGPGGLAEASSGLWAMTVTPAAGRPLEFHSGSRSGGKSDSIYVGQFQDPPESPDVLTVRIEVDDVEIFSTVAMPVRTEPA
ncbi:hypothetical protein HDA40_002078 [Hamadaea flava]|uniref:Uncharacterized protein n=1 Tax=Hamadaea flava TaxID=1742688 RepID=A0ABV8LKX0_9ACTN|nr:hypothetical protein [Hamadaea flava]MCP2323571.1 hypothetical protein [Hamadaea flava]